MGSLRLGEESADMTPLQENTSNHILSLGMEFDVHGTGSPSSQIVIVAEFPGETEIALKQRLVGASSRYLWQELAKIGVKREQCYITNVIKRRVQTDQKEKLSVPAEERRKWGAVLAQELSQLSTAWLRHRNHSVRRNSQEGIYHRTPACLYKTPFY